MTSWEETLRELRGEFVRGSLLRVERMRSLLRLLSASPKDETTCHELMLQFHGLAGSGATYGFPEVTRLGLAGERLLGGRDTEEQADTATLASAGTLIEDLGHALDSGGRVAEGAGAAPAEPAPPLRWQVLVVEDDDVTRAMLQQRLEQEGYEVRSAATRALAEAAIRERVPDALVCDVMLPDGNGYELVAALRLLPQGDDIPVLMASVRADFLDKVEALTSGADGYYEKPVDWDELLRRLQHLLERRRLEPARILCVEDFDEHAAYLRAVLGSVGYEVEVLADPRGFEATLLAFRPDLVLMDILLPGLSGYELTRFLRQYSRFAALPVLFMTTDAQPDARIRGLQAGGDDHLVKPVSPALLLTAVACHLERARLVKSLTERDGLTRLLTHSAFLGRAREVWDRTRRRPQLRPTLVMMDLDMFKTVNDRFGHATGDVVLAAFAALLRRRLRQSDVLGRYGGEEFAVLLEGLEEPDVTRLANRLREEFGATEHQAPDSAHFKVTVSAGVSPLYEAMSFEVWTKSADDALYAAKQAGRDCVVTTPFRASKES